MMVLVIVVGAGDSEKCCGSSDCDSFGGFAFFIVFPMAALNFGVEPDCRLQPVHGAGQVCL